MQQNKLYAGRQETVRNFVEVVCINTKDGRLIPKSVFGEDGKEYGIDSVID